MRDLEGVIIDMEGVLIDGADILRQSYTSCLTAYGVPYTEADHRQYMGQNDRHIFNDMKKRYPTLITPLPMLAKARNDHYARLLKTKAEPRAGVMEFLTLIQQQNVPLGLASFASKTQIEGLLDNLGLRTMFKVIVSNEMVARGKPSPDIYQLAVHYLEVKSDACIILESSEIGVEAAATAGARVVAVPGANSRYDDLSLADLQLESLEQVDLHDMMAEVALLLPEII